MNTYRELRQAFLATAQRHGATLKSYTIPDCFGPHGEELATDVASIGPLSAKTVKISSSGVHGLELPFWSRMQCEQMEAASCATARDQSVRYLFVHALNPGGAAYDRRTDLENIDPNRNFLESFDDLPETSGTYHALADAFSPPRLGMGTFLESWSRLLFYALVTHGPTKFKRALCNGQYEYPDGLYFGGEAPSWTNRTWREIVATHVVPFDPSLVIHADLHTGDGPRGKMRLLLNDPPASPLYAYARKIWAPQDVVATKEVIASVTGDILDSWRGVTFRRPCTVYAFAAEIGTSKAPSAVEGLDVLKAMIQVNTLNVRHNGNHPKAEAIRRMAREKFNPSAPDWQELAEAQARAFWKKAISVDCSI